MADNACSQLAAAGGCVSTVVQSLTLVLRALCQHKAAAVVSYIPQACAESGAAPCRFFPVQSWLFALLLVMLLVSANATMAVETILKCHVLQCIKWIVHTERRVCAAGYVLSETYAGDSIALLATTPSNCPTEANILSCSQEQVDGHGCPQSSCSILCALSGASGLSVTGYKTLSSNNSASRVSAHRATIISVVALGEWPVCVSLSDVFSQQWTESARRCCSLDCHAVSQVPDPASCLSIHATSVATHCTFASTHSISREQCCLELHMNICESMQGCSAGVLFLLLVLFLGWKLRRFLLCSCCLPDPDQTPSVETHDLLRVTQAARSRSQTTASGFQTE